MLTLIFSCFQEQWDQDLSLPQWSQWLSVEVVVISTSQTPRPGNLTSRPDSNTLKTSTLFFITILLPNIICTCTQFGFRTANKAGLSSLFTSSLLFALCGQSETISKELPELICTLHWDQVKIMHIWVLLFSITWKKIIMKTNKMLLEEEQVYTIKTIWDKWWIWNINLTWCKN